MCNSSCLNEKKCALLRPPALELYNTVEGKMVARLRKSESISNLNEPFLSYFPTVPETKKPPVTPKSRQEQPAKAAQAACAQTPDVGIVLGSGREAHDNHTDAEKPVPRLRPGPWAFGAAWSTALLVPGSVPSWSSWIESVPEGNIYVLQDWCFAKDKSHSKSLGGLPDEEATLTTLNCLADSKTGLIENKWSGSSIFSHSHTKKAPGF